MDSVGIAMRTASPGDNPYSEKDGNMNQESAVAGNTNSLGNTADHETRLSSYVFPSSEVIAWGYEHRPRIDGTEDGLVTVGPVEIALRSFGHWSGQPIQPAAQGPLFVGEHKAVISYIRGAHLRALDLGA